MKPDATLFNNFLVTVRSILIADRARTGFLVRRHSGQKFTVQGIIARSQAAILASATTQNRGNMRYRVNKRGRAMLPAVCVRVLVRFSLQRADYYCPMLETVFRVRTMFTAVDITFSFGKHSVVMESAFKTARRTRNGKLNKNLRELCIFFFLLEHLLFEFNLF